MVRPWNTRHLVVQLFASAIEWMHWSLGLVAFEILVSMIYKRNECRTPNGERSFTAPCNTIYAGVAFGGILILLNFIAAMAIAVVFRLDIGTKWWEKLYSRTANNDNVAVTDENLI